MPRTSTEEQVALKRSLGTIEKGFSLGDAKLRDWLASLPPMEFGAILAILDRSSFNDAKTDRWLHQVWRKQAPAISRLDQRVGAILLVHELREYAGHTLNVFVSKPHYEEILRRVHRRLAKAHRSRGTVPEVATIRFREQAITEMLTGDALASLTTDELVESLMGADIAGGEANTRKLLAESLATGGLPALVKLVGKKTIKKVVLLVIEKYLAKELGAKATAEILKRIAKQIPQKSFARVLSFVSLALLAWDVYGLGAEAKRVTTPLVVNLALYRTVAILEDDKVVPANRIEAL